MNHLRDFRHRFAVGDERFDRTFNRLGAGDHIRITAGPYRDSLGYIGYIHLRTTLNNPPQVTVITEEGEELVCNFNLLELTDNDTSSDDDDEDDDDSDDDDDPNRHQYRAPFNENILDETLAQLSLQVAAMILMKEDPNRSWRHFKHATVDNLNARMRRPLADIRALITDIRDTPEQTTSNNSIGTEQ